MKHCILFFFGMLFLSTGLFSQTDSGIYMDSLFRGDLPVPIQYDSLSPDAGLLLEPVTSEMVTPTQAAVDVTPPNGGELYLPDVRALPYQASVTPTGAAVIQIPIEVSPGTAGMQPNLSLVYSSQGDNGILGKGWTLSGISAVTRIGQTIYHDGKFKGVTLDTSDRFALDGNRLIKMENNIRYGASGASYVTENPDFSVITGGGYAYDRSGPKYFNCKTKNGSDVRYGNTSDSRVSMLGGYIEYAWYINRIQDINGNYMTYEYLQENKQILLRKISYTGNSSMSMTPYDSVVFGYINKNTSRIYYVGGGVYGSDSIRENKLLSEIKVYSEGQLVRRYAFTYDAGQEVLLEIALYNRYGTKIANQLNGWSLKGEENFDRNVIFYSGYGSINWDLNKHPRFMADVNGDGMADIVGFSSNQVLVSLANGGGFDDAREWFTGNFTLDHGWSPNNQRYVFDVNGDGFADILGFAQDGVQINLSNGKDKFIQSSYGLNGFGNTQYGDKDSKYTRHFADINGDGLPDIVGFAHEGVAYAINTGNGFDLRYANGLFANYSKSENKFFVADVNGDGLDDLVVIKAWIFEYGLYKVPMADQVYVCLSNGTNFSNPVCWHTFNQSYRLAQGTDDPDILPVQIDIADANGDGKKDIIIVNTYQGGVFVYLSTGSGFQYAGKWANGYGGDQEKYPRIIQDLNGDGLADIFMFGHDNTAIGVNTGSGFRDVYPPQFGNNFCRSNGWVPEDHIRTFADINGDGIPDIVGFGCNGVAVAKGKSNVSQYLQTIINEGKEKATFTYSISCNDPAVYKKAYGLQRPYMNYNGPMTVVKTLSQPNGIGGWNATNYSYEGAKIHSTGKGFLGFSKTASWNTIFNTLDSVEYTILPMSLNPVVKRTASYLYSPCQKLVESDNTYTESTTKEGKRYILSRVLNKTTDHLGKTGTTTTETLFDQLTNITSKTINYNNLSESTERYFYKALPNVSTTAFLPESSAYIYGYTGKPYQRDDRRYEYDTKGRLLRIYHYDSTNTIPLTNTTYEYNNFGLPTKVSTNQGMQSSGSRYVSYEYDRKGRFCTKQADALGGQTFTYDSLTGQKLTVQGINNGLTERYGYGLAEELAYSISPLNIKTVYEQYLLDAHPHADAPSNAFYYTVTTTPKQPKVTVFYDWVGRPLRTVTQNFNGTIFTDIGYNAKGQKVKESKPYFKGEGTSWTFYFYDEYHRVIKITSPAGKSITTTYNGLTTRIDYPDSTYKITTVNVLGEPVSVIDGGGTIAYAYKAPGQVSEINAVGAVTKMEYDAYGRQTKLVDPDAGAVTYEYDLWGNPVKQTDARGKVRSTFYDGYGRMVAEHYDQNNLQYHYYESGNLKGKLHTITRNNTSIKQYGYDAFGRVMSASDIINGVTMTTFYEYDAYGRKIRHIFPSRYAVDYKYDDLGNIIEVLYGGVSMWRLSSVNALGQIKEVSYGIPESKIRYYLSYDQEHRLNGKSLKPRFENQPMIELQNYAWDPKGNLSWRKHTVNSQYETFTYDHLQRLKTMSSGLPIDYQDNGNISYKIQYDYFYNNASKPHAVKNIVQRYWAIDDNYTYGDEIDISYNTLGKATRIERGSKTADFIYGADRQRVYMKKTDGNQVKERYYSENCELDNGTLHRDYVYTPTGLTAIVENGQYRFVMTDHLGSIVTVMDAYGTPVQHLSYDAWGKRRSPTNYLSYTLTSAPLYDRGFTGHEHLDEFQLINMNGRLYDPTLGRFLSPDNYVANATNTQDFNRYTYCRNNPLIYTDPSGEFITWGIGKGGFSIGFNLTPIGIPLGGGLNFGWSDGFSMGAYTEVGYRVGGTGFGSGATITQSFDYNFKHDNWSTTTSAGAYASYLCFNAGGNVSYTYDISNKQGNYSWGVSGGVGIGNDVTGIGLYVGYGSGGWTYGVGGFYNPASPQRPKVYTSPIGDNWGEQNGECVLRCLEEFSNSYDLPAYDFCYWYEENGEKLGVHANNVQNLINGTGVFSSESINSDPISIANAFSENKRVIMGVSVDQGNHAVMIEKVKIWPSGKYKIWFAETSPVRQVPRTVTNTFTLIGPRMFTFSPSIR